VTEIHRLIEAVQQVIRDAELEARAHNPILDPKDVDALREVVDVLRGLPRTEDAG
jgi:hypothetical protein